MNAEAARRIVALTRRIESFKQMRKRDSITEQEANALIEEANAEIRVIRSQQEMFPEQGDKPPERGSKK